MAQPTNPEVKNFKCIIVYLVKNGTKTVVRTYTKNYPTEAALKKQILLLNSLVPTGTTEDKQGRFEFEVVDSNQFSLLDLKKLLNITSYRFYKEHGFLIVVNKDTYVNNESNYLTTPVTIDGVETTGFNLIANWIRQQTGRKTKVELNFSFYAANDEALKKELNRPDQTIIEGEIPTTIAPGIVAYLPNQWTTNKPKVSVKLTGEKLGDFIK
jgi:hypothetical protein